MSRVVLGNSSLAAYPQGGGHWMVFLQYLLGLEALGHDVFYLELLESQRDPVRNEFLIEKFFQRLGQYGFRERSALLLFEKGAKPDLATAIPYGRSHAQIRSLAAEADVLWNFCGAFKQPMLSLFRRRCFVDLDPGHLHVSAGDYDYQLGEHQAFLTIGLKMHDPDCEVPNLGIAWKTFHPFAHLPLWRARPDPGPAAPLTSITHWEWTELWSSGRRLSLSKREAYLRYLDLPTRTGRPFQLAANIHVDDSTGDRELLRTNGWQLVHPYDVASSPEAYQDFIAGSRAEFLCPKPIFRELRTGWFSDRSVCYLASGRPVICEETGFSDHLPSGAGIVAFRSPDEAREAVAEVDANYAFHARQARELAEGCFDAGSTLDAMLSAS